MNWGYYIEQCKCCVRFHEFRLYWGKWIKINQSIKNNPKKSTKITSIFVNIAGCNFLSHINNKQLKSVSEKAI